MARRKPTKSVAEQARYTPAEVRRIRNIKRREMKPGDSKPKDKPSVPRRKAPRIGVLSGENSALKRSRGTILRPRRKDT